MPISDLLAQITGEPSPLQSTATLPLKRKADGDVGKPLNRMQRMGYSTGNRPSVVDSSMVKSRFNSHPRSSMPSPTTTFNTGRPTPPPSTDASSAKAPPKKGSFAEIMARGRAAQSTLGQIGKIQHKKIEKRPGKRNQKEMKAKKSHQIYSLTTNNKFRAAREALIADELSGSLENNGMIKPELEKKVKKAVTATTGYAGTARPKPGAKSLSEPSASTSASRYVRDRERDRSIERAVYEANKNVRPSRRYEYASEQEDMEEREYDSDVSSDMEAAVYEVDDEEEQATRIARREDAEALAEENKLKREKEEKRKRLAAMAKSRR